jgi:hypothetical protein
MCSVFVRGRWRDFYPCRPVGQNFSYLGHAKIDRALPFDRLKGFLSKISLNSIIH